MVKCIFSMKKSSNIRTKLKDFKTLGVTFFPQAMASSAPAFVGQLWWRCAARDCETPES
jgi:hypothetical protein